jgi:hypothetical protein
MYLVFDLPDGSDYAPSAHTIAYWLHREFDTWHEKYQIPYKTKFHKDRLRFILSTTEEYTFFMLSWDPNYKLNGYKIDPFWATFTIVEPPKY